MGKLIVPRPNSRERAVFDIGNITLIESITEEEYLEMAAEYLSNHNVLHLSTCRDNEPRSTPLEYFNNGITVYIFSEGGGKMANLKANTKVSYSISDPYHPSEDFFGASGLQVWGISSVFKKNDDPERFNQICSYSRNAGALKEQGLDGAAESYNFNVITIEPTKISRLSYRKGFRNVVWKKEE
jgi:hypothetical protein